MGAVAVLDASALIAVLDGEAGADAVAGSLGASVISAVNLVEVLQREPAIRLTKPLDVEGLGIQVVPFTAAQARSAAAMRHSTRGAGLSLADRACLALARELDVTAVTADRAWAKVDVGVEVTLIR